MAVVIETTLGDITVDLYLDQRPVTCLNFLKLCKMKYYNYNLFHSIRSGFIAQTGDPTGEGSGGQSIFGVLEGPEKRFFSGEKLPKIRHTDAGLLSMVCTDDMMVGSQFFFTLAPDLDSLDGIHCVIGQVTEGHDVLRKLNDVICDETHRPYRDVRITHTVVLEDPFNDPPGLRAPSRSPSPNPERLKGGRIAPDEEIDETQGKSAAEIQELIEEKEAKARATILEIVGDLPDADIAPPENVLFVCKLNPVTTDEDLEIIFSRFGKIIGCEVIRDKKTGNSLQYAFIEFADKKSCEDAYFKMDNVLIDDRRIHVDFSQSVSKMRWLGKGKGIQHFDEEKAKRNHRHTERSIHSRSREWEENNKKEYYNAKEDKYNKRSEYRNTNKDKTINRDQKRHKQSENNLHIDRNKNETRHKERKRSRSRSKLDRHNQETSKSEHKTDSLRNNHDRNSSRYSDRDHHRNHSDSKSNRESNKSRNHSPVSNTTKSHNLTKFDSKRSHIYESKEQRSQKDKSNKKDYDNNHEERRETKSVHNRLEARTPTPPSKEKKFKNRSNNKDSKKIVTKSTSRKRHKSESSSSDSESSSSSSSDSSCSRNKKKKKSNRKKRKYSSSSSSSESSSSTSSSSSSDSSSSTTSSSDSEPNKKRKKISSKKTVKKAKKK